MALLYDSFGIRRVAVEVNLWPAIDSFAAGDLSALFGRLNTDDIFTSCELRPQTGASFEGELWTYDLHPSTLRIRCFGFATPEQLYGRIRSLLEGTRGIVRDRSLAFYTDEIRVFAEVPEGGKRMVGDIVQRRLVGRLKAEDRAELPGLQGAGLSLVGATDSYHWHAEIEPRQGVNNSLSLVGRLVFFPESEPPRPGPDLDVIDEHVKTTCDFVRDPLQTFSTKLFR